MKTLYLVRHAKSSWEHSLQSDFERPLNERGLQAAPLVARRLKEKNIRPALIVTSPANRAQTTAEIFADILEYPGEKIVQNMAIYTANAETLLQIMRSLPENSNSAMLFGHNPAMTEFSNFLTGENLDNLVTCGVLCIEMNEISWGDACKGSGKRIWYDYPKKQK